MKILDVKIQGQGAKYQFTVSRSGPEITAEVHDGSGFVLRLQQSKSYYNNGREEAAIWLQNTADGFEGKAGSVFPYLQALLNLE